MDAKTLCLGILTRGDASGYEIYKAFEEGPYHHFFDVGFGSIYPALGRLADEGLVSGRDEPQEKRPDKKVYTITPEGRRAFAAALESDPAPDKVRSEFLFILSFADMLPPDRAGRIVDARLAALRERIERMESPECAPDTDSRRFVHGFGLAIYRAMENYLTVNRRLVAKEDKEKAAPRPPRPGATAGEPSR